MEEKNLTEQESLYVIQQMIQTAKQEQKDNGKGWIVWGWLLFIISLLTYANIQYHWYDTAFFWNVFGGIVLLWLLFIIIRHLFMNLGVPPSKGFMLLIGLYGFWILVYGAALNFKPSIIAAYVTWAIGFVGLFIDKFEETPDKRFQWVMLFHALAVLCGYIIPGHIANKEFNRINKKGNIQSV